MNIGFVLYDGVTQLDAMGPLQILDRLPGASVVTLAETTGPVSTDCPVKLLPTHDFASSPDLDMICVPGGFGTADAIKNNALMDFVRAQAQSAKYVTSVCTGSLILGAAGLLEGKRATTHWAYTDLLSELGAIPTEGRVVQDGNTFTGGGVTAGIDFALTIAAALKGEEVAKSLQLGFEYDPAPPFDTGHPSKASGEFVDRMRGFYAGRHEELRAAFGAARG